MFKPSSASRSSPELSFATFTLLALSGLVSCTSLPSSSSSSSDEAAAPELSDLPLSEIQSAVLSAAELDDYYLQDVCLDGAGQPTAQDPYTCTTRRNLALDEAIRFLRHDMPVAGRPYGYQMGSSAPFRLANGTLGVLHIFDFGGFTEGDGVLRAFREFNRVGGFSATAPATGKPIDGYDLLERAGTYAAYAGTCDGGGGVQPFAHWTNGPGTCVNEDGWVLWNQNDVPTDGSSRSTVATLRIAPGACPTNFMDSAFTTWRMADVTYTSGKALRSLISTHYGGGSVASAGSFERFYYTKPYGRTRWEAWRTSGTAGGNCNGATTEGNFIRVDCRDWSYGVADPDDGQHPLSWPVDARLGRGNLLVNSDFGAGPTYLGPWNRIDNANLNRSILEESSADALRNFNHLLSVSWTGAGGNSIYQDVPRGSSANLPTGAPISFGARLWTSSPGAPITLRVYQLRANGSVATFHDVSVSLSAARSRYTGWFPVHADAATFRFELYVGQANVTVFLDDAHLTRM